MRVLVAGASGFVGRRLCPAPVEAGHKVLAMTRHPDRYFGEGPVVYGDVHRPDTLLEALGFDDAVRQALRDRQARERRSG